MVKDDKADMNEMAIEVLQGDLKAMKKENAEIKAGLVQITELLKKGPGVSGLPSPGPPYQAPPAPGLDMGAMLQVLQGFLSVQRQMKNDVIEDLGIRAEHGGPDEGSAIEKQGIELIGKVLDRQVGGGGKENASLADTYSPQTPPSPGPIPQKPAVIMPVEEVPE